MASTTAKNIIINDHDEKSIFILFFKIIFMAITAIDIAKINAVNS